MKKYLISCIFSTLLFSLNAQLNCNQNVILSSGVQHSGSTSDGGFYNSYYSCLGGSYSGDEVVHEITTTMAGTADIEVWVGGGFSNWAATAITRPCDANACINGWFVSSGSTLNESFSVTSNTTYYFIVDEGSGFGDIPYEIKVTLPGGSGGNLDCSSNVTLMNGVTHNGNTSNGAFNAEIYSCTPQESQLGDELVHEFTAPFSGVASIDFNTNGNPFDLFGTLYMLSACNTSSCIQHWFANANDTYTMTAGNTYYFVVDEGSGFGGLAYSLTVSINTTSVIDISSYLYQVHPNPVQSMWQVGAHQNFTCSLYNETGQVVMEQTGSSGDNVYDLSGLSSGIYVSQFKFSDGTSYSMKLLKL